MVTSDKNKITTYNYLQGIVFALYSKAFYRDVCLNWRGIGALYVIVISSILFIPGVVSFNYWVKDLLGLKDNIVEVSGGRYQLPERLAEIANQIPDMVIEKGRLSLSEDIQQPYIIYSNIKEKPILAIDTTGKITSPSDVGAYAVLTERTLAAKKRNGEIEYYNLKLVAELLGGASEEKLAIDKDFIAGILEQSVNKISVVSASYYITGTFMSLANNGLRALLLSVPALLMCGFITGREIPFSVLLRLSMVSSTPVIILNALSSYFFMQKIFSQPELVYFTVHAWFLYFAMKSVKK